MLLSLLLLGFLLWPCSSGCVQVDAKRLRLKLPDWLLSCEFAIDSPVQRNLTLGSSNSQRRTHARSSSLVENNVGRWAAFGSLMMRWSCASRERGALGGSDRVRNNFRPVTTSVDTLRYVQPSLFNIIIGHPRGGRYVTRYTVWWAQTQTNDTKQARAHSVDTCTYTGDHTNERASYTKVDTYGLRTGIHTRTAEGDSRIHGGWMQGGYTVDRRWIQAGWIHGRYLVDLPFCRGTTSRGIRAKRYIHHVSTVYPPCIDHVSTVYRTYLLTTYRVRVP